MKYPTRPLIGLSMAVSLICSLKSKETIDWPVYLGDSASSQYSKAKQITPENVNQLEVAWTYVSDDDPRGNIECNPLVIDGILYGTDSKWLLFAVDATTGKELWRFDHTTFLESFGVKVKGGGAHRGIAYWTDGKEKRILFGVNAYLIALDARTGKPIPGFGEKGAVNLRIGLGKDVGESAYFIRSPGIVFEDLIIMGSSVSESHPAAPGHIRAFDVRTGEQKWRFNTIPEPGEFGYETWPAEAYSALGGANVWAGMSLDEERGLVYCPTGSATYDFYGANRIGANLFANTLLCLDARTGERVWHYQTVHHDILDYDLPSPPNLLTITRDGIEIPAVAQLTKQGFVFVFNRVTGEPLFPIEEVPVPESPIPGEQAWATQPRPVKPAPYVRERFTIEEITDISPESHAEVLNRYKNLRPHEPFQPLSVEHETVVHPGMLGGAEWGGGAASPDGILYFNANELPAIITVLDTDKIESEAQAIFTQICAVCHGTDMKGGNAFGQVVPSLEGIKDRLRLNDAMEVIKYGRGNMPAFSHLSNEQVYQIAQYVIDQEEYSRNEANRKEKGADRLRFLHTGNHFWTDSKGYPAIRPPWGTLNAIDLNTGEYIWRHRFGEYSELTEKGVPLTGRVSFGGPVITAGGVLFIAASTDNHIRGYDMKTGEEIWKVKLPFGGYATPATYTVDGKQFVVIACGGGRGSPSSNMYVAFALP